MRVSCPAHLILLFHHWVLLGYLKSTNYDASGYVLVSILVLEPPS
jgi:hypothetical protein